MPTTHRISSLAAVASVAAILSLPAAASAVPVYDNGIVNEHLSPQAAAKWEAYDDAIRASSGSPAQATAVSDDGGFPLPMAGGAIAIAMLSFGGVAVAVKRRKTIRPAFPTV